ncbi:MAG: FecR domain-containing protein [Pseudomonadota bacterium]
MTDDATHWAIHWLLQQRDGGMDASGWEEFTQWLEADERHAQVYDELTETDSQLDEWLPQLLETLLSKAGASDASVPEAANDNPITRFIPWVAASAAAVVLAMFAWPQGAAQTTLVETSPGEVRTLALGDGIAMTMNGSSVVEVTQGAPRVTIERGEVAFAITSEGPSPLRVAVDGLVLTDIGTEFNVVLTDTDLRVAVAEGIIAVNPDQENIEVPVGEAVEKERGSDTLVRKSVDPELVASWREGRLEFDDTPIERALAQLERSAGVIITLAPRLAGERLTGSVALDAEPEVIAQRFAAFVGGTAKRNDESWVIE